MTQFQNDRRPNSSRPTLRRPHKPRPWSHQRELQELVGKKIKVLFMNDEPKVGKVVASDAFTIKLAFDDKSAFTYYKHAVAGYEVV